jgi:hypothetical protein
MVGAGNTGAYELTSLIAARSLPSVALRDLAKELESIANLEIAIGGVVDKLAGLTVMDMNRVLREFLLASQKAAQQIQKAPPEEGLAPQ